MRETENLRIVEVDSIPNRRSNAQIIVDNFLESTLQRGKIVGYRKEKAPAMRHIFSNVVAQPEYIDKVKMYVRDGEIYLEKRHDRIEV